jgi:hypothetical protein
MPIRRVRGRWKIDKVPGTSATRLEAVQRLKAIKAKQRSK